MSYRVIIVEDEIFVAIEMESVLLELGHKPVGIAADSRKAMELARDAEIAFVDLNLIDGPTGIEIGRRLAQSGVTVVFMTANPDQIAEGVPGVIGVLAKPVSGEELKAAVRFAEAARRRDRKVSAPRRLKLFDFPPDTAGAIPA